MCRLELHNYLNTLFTCLGLIKAKQMIKSTYCLGKNCWMGCDLRVGLTRIGFPVMAQEPGQEELVVHGLAYSNI